ncbi:hypothetical protein R3P38DRAFT_2416177, partial [Favolaschia claudopus]
GVSVSVERLFSSLRHTVSDERASMTAKTIAVDMVTKEWLKSGLADDVDYTQFIKIRGN